MTRLLKVELARALARRAIRILPVLLLGAIGLNAYVVHENVRWWLLTDADVQQNYAQQLSDWQAWGEEEYERCLAYQEAEGIEPGSPEDGCYSWAPVLEDVQAQAFSIADQLPEFIFVFAILGLFVMLIGGATLTAVEFSERTLGTWLTFEPRRGRVFASKVAAPVVLAFPAMVIYLALVVGSAILVVRLHGGNVVGSGQEWIDLGLTVLRGGFLGAGVAAVGAAGGLLVRRTAGVLGAAMIYLILVELILTALMPSIQRWSLGKNFQAWIEAGTQWSTWNCSMSGCTERFYSIDMWPAGIYLLIVAAAVLALSLTRFWRSDIE